MDNKSTLWIIDDDRSIRWVLEKATKQSDIEVESFESANGILNTLIQRQPNAIITDIQTRSYFLTK